VDNDLKVGGDHHDDQVPEAPQRQQGQEQPDRQRVQDPPGGQGGQGPPGPLQPGAAQPGQPPDDRVVHDRDLDGEAAQPPAKTASESATSTIEATSQPTPLIWR
jgi:hypothetical protein